MNFWGCFAQSLLFSILKLIGTTNLASLLSNVLFDCLQGTTRDRIPIRNDATFLYLEQIGKNRMRQTLWF